MPREVRGMGPLPQQGVAPAESRTVRLSFQGLPLFCLQWPSTLRFQPLRKSTGSGLQRNQTGCVSGGR